MDLRLERWSEIARWKAAFSLGWSQNTGRWGSEKQKGHHTAQQREVFGRTGLCRDLHMVGKKNIIFKSLSPSCLYMRIT